MIKNVAGYILIPGYHNVVVHKYGVLALPDRKYYSMGWDIRLLGYVGIEGIFTRGALLLQRMELMAHFPVAVVHRWSIDAITFRTGSGTYFFTVSSIFLHLSVFSHSPKFIMLCLINIHRIEC